jgi:hypothetical protein
MNGLILAAFVTTGVAIYAAFGPEAQTRVTICDEAVAEAISSLAPLTDDKAALLRQCLSIEEGE